MAWDSHRSGSVNRLNDSHSQSRCDKIAECRDTEAARLEGHLPMVLIKICPVGVSVAKMFTLSYTESSKDLFKTLGIGQVSQGLSLLHDHL